MIPVRVCDEDRRQVGEARGVGAKRLVRGARRIGPRAGVDRDEVAPVGRDDEGVLGELESREEVDPTGDDLRDLPRRECVAGGGILREWGRERDRLLGVAFADEAAELLGLRSMAGAPMEVGEADIDLSHPTRMRRFLGIREAPLEILERDVAPPEERRHASRDHPTDPPDDEDLSL